MNHNHRHLMKWEMKKNYKKYYKRMDRLASTMKKEGIDVFFLSSRSVDEKRAEQKRVANIHPEALLNAVASAMVDMARNGGVDVRAVLDVLSGKVLSRTTGDENASQ